MDGSRYDVFLSHSAEDGAAAGAVRALAGRLREAGLRAWDARAIVPGTPVMEATEAALEQSETIAVLVGASGIGPWQNEEWRVSLDRSLRSRDDLRVIPVLLPGAALPLPSALLARRSPVDFSHGLDDEGAFAQLVAGVRGEAPAGPATTGLPDEPAPYPGLLAFSTAQARFFYGRGDDCAALRARVEGSPLVAVIGPSGSGKSSLVLAGLLPGLPPTWRAVTLVPGARPLRALANQVAMLAAQGSAGGGEAQRGLLARADELEARMAADAGGLARALSTQLAALPTVATLLIVVDQVEELFTQVVGPPAEVAAQQRQFIANLKDAARSLGGRVRIVMTLRSDFVDHWLRLRDIATEPEVSQVLLRPMSIEALREAIVMPARAIGLLFEKGLVGRLIEEMEGQPAALPLLQFTLAELWRRRRGFWLTHEAYEELGGLSGAIDRRAHAIFSALSPADQRLARTLFLRMVAMAEQVTYTRRRVRRSELQLIGAASGDVERLIAMLSRGDVRLIAAESDSVELAHEALISHWGELHGWLEANRGDLLILRRITDAAGEWEAKGRDRSYLFGGARLAEAAAAASRAPLELNRAEQAFLAAGARAEAGDRRLRRAALALATLALAALVWAMLAEVGPFARTIEWTAAPGLEVGEVVRIARGPEGTVYASVGFLERGETAIARWDAAQGRWALTTIVQAYAFVADLEAHPQEAGLLYAAMSDQGLYRSRDGGASWEQVQTPVGWVDSVALHAGQIFFSTHQGRPGTYVSDDEGLSWRPVPGAPPVGAITLDWVGDRLVVGLQAQGLHSWSEGEGWQQLIPGEMTVNSLLALGDTLFAGGSDGVYRIEADGSYRELLDLSVTSLALADEARPRLVGVTTGSSFFGWDGAEATVTTLGDDQEMGGYTYAAGIVPSAEGSSYLAGTDQGLRQGIARPWFYSLMPNAPRPASP